MNYPIMSSLTPPKSFAYHDARIVRGRYPDNKGVQFITDMGIRKFVSLGAGFPGAHERNMGKSNKIEITHYPISVIDYSEFQTHFEDQLESVIDYILVNNPDSKIYVYDDDGYSVVGIVCAILRRIEGWNTMAAIAECTRFFPGGNFNTDVALLINNFDITKWN